MIVSTLRLFSHLIEQPKTYLRNDGTPIDEEIRKTEALLHGWRRKQTKILTFEAMNKAYKPVFNVGFVLTLAAMAGIGSLSIGVGLLVGSVFYQSVFPIFQSFSESARLSRRPKDNSHSVNRSYAKHLASIQDIKNHLKGLSFSQSQGETVPRESLDDVVKRRHYIEQYGHASAAIYIGHESKVNKLPLAKPRPVSAAPVRVKEPSPGVQLPDLDRSSRAA